MRKFKLFKKKFFRELKYRGRNSAARGFTLIEMLLAVALIGALTGLAIPVYQSFQVKNDLDIATDTIAQSLRRAQILAQASDGDMSWGLRIESGKIVVFKGASFAGRDAGFDELFAFPGSLSRSGLQEVVFAKFSGLPQATGDIILSSSTGETRNININAKGTITY